jgi:DNA-binding transcriptional LysR family regulator
VQIVQRGHRFEGFTPEGKQVLLWAHRILAEQDARRHELSSMRGGLSGVLRIGAIPTALTVASLLTAPLRERHPLVRISLESQSSREIVQRLSEYDIDVGMTSVDGEPLGTVRAIPLYREGYLLLTPSESEFAGRDSVGWAEAAKTPLCLLSPVMQNRRIIDRNFAETGVTVTPLVETDTVSAIYAHVGTMRLSSVIAHAWLYLFGVPDGMRVGAVAATAAVPSSRPGVGRPGSGTDVGSRSAGHGAPGGYARRVGPGGAAAPANPAAGGLTDGAGGGRRAGFDGRAL